MIINRENIDELVERWLDGESSLEEERALGDYFASESEIPSHLAWAATLFARNAAKRNIHSPQRRQAAPRHTLRYGLVATVSIAAAIAVGLFVTTRQQATLGPCAYINGEKVCDRAVVAEMTAPVFEYISQTMQPIQKVYDGLSTVKSSTEKAAELLNKYNIEKLLQQ